MQPHI